MSSGEMPIGTAKGKQPNTEALRQSPPPPLWGGVTLTCPGCSMRNPVALKGSR